jgi:hypothetical protein
MWMKLSGSQAGDFGFGLLTRNENHLAVGERRLDAHAA